MAFTANLVPHRTTWQLIRRTWTPMLAGLAVVVLAELLEPVSEAASSVVGVLSSLVFMGGVLWLGATWQRGPTLAVDGGVLTLGRARVPVADVVATRGTHVYDSQARFAAGRFWAPLLTLRLPDGQELRIACTGAGGRAPDAPPTDPPHFHLPEPQWEQLARLLRA